MSRPREATSVAIRIETRPKEEISMGSSEQLVGKECDTVKLLANLS